MVTACLPYMVVSIVVFRRARAASYYLVRAAIAPAEFWKPRSTTAVLEAPRASQYTCQPHQACLVCSGAGTASSSDGARFLEQVDNML